MIGQSESCKIQANNEQDINVAKCAPVLFPS